MHVWKSHFWLGFLLFIFGFMFNSSAGIIEDGPEFSSTISIVYSRGNHFAYTIEFFQTEELAINFSNQKRNHLHSHESQDTIFSTATELSWCYACN
jgi:hypothetical protein